MKLILLDKENNEEITDGYDIIKMSDLESKMEYEDWGLQSDGQPVVFDKCGNFGYLDPNVIRVCVDLLDDTH